MKLLREHGLTPSPRNIGRLMFIFHNAFWASFFTWQEKNSYGRKIGDWPVPDDPVVIIGHWRTGSTLLHLLMSQDEQFIAPSLFQGAFPDCFLSAEKFYRPVMGRLVNKRPMDNVQLGFDDAQEDEFALLKLTLDSPLLDLVFPEKEGYFINHYEDFNPTPDRSSLWKEKLRDLGRKIRQDSGKILLLKNPAHSLRIPFLMEVFPKVRFIHIHRHPYRVVASSMNLWKVLTDDNLLKGKARYPQVEEVADGLNKFYELIRRDLQHVPEGRKSEIAYEDLIASPMRGLRKIYADLGIHVSNEFGDAVSSFLERNKDFKKNSYTFGEADQQKVYERMKKHFDHFNYQR
jgi:hypothetical protein